MPHTRERKRKRVILVVALLLAAAGLAALGPLFRHGYDTTLLALDLAGREPPLPDYRPAFGVREISYEAAGVSRLADLYEPQTPARAGLVLVPGAAEGGRRDARLVEFAGAMARCGFAVLVPDIPSFRELRPTPDSTREIADGVLRLRGGSELAAGLRLGIGAFSIASGPAVLTVLDTDAGERVDFLLLVGGYHDLPRTLTFLTTGYFEIDGQPRRRQPDSYGKWVYALANAGRLRNRTDRETLAAIAERKIATPDADVDRLRERLGPSGRAVYAFITNTDPQRVPELLARLPAPVRADIEALDLAARDLSATRAEFILVHGFDDSIIPFTESVSLARALPPGQARLFLLEGLHHVDRDIGGADAWHMWRALRAVLEQRDGGPA
jgi:fermentation-respiration switch protein FrsA (DUF1100 family)